VPVSESLAAVATSPFIKGVLEFFKYLFFGTGILSRPILSMSLFVRSTSLNKDGTGLRDEIPSKAEKGNITSRPQDNIPDIELMPIAFSAMDNLEEHQRDFSKIGVFSILATLLQPKSRGTVRLASSNPHDRPKIDFGILSNPADLTLARKAIRLSLKLGEAMKESGFPLLRNLVFPEEKQEIDMKNNNDDEMDKFIRRRARTTYHYACTCRMAPKDDAEAPGVVDDHLRVHGVRNLRVCDTSVFPKIVSAHLQAPAVMVAERCADWIKKDAVIE
jgi:choline dehydrogenase